jgi:type II secretory pathway component PulF
MRLTRSRQLALLEDFALALHDGLSPLQASMELAQHARQYGLVDELALSEGIVQALNQGHSFASVLPRWFDADLCMLVSVGEHSGVLEQLLQQHRQFELQRQQAQQLFWRPLIYPMIMVVIAALASLLIGRQVMPKLAAGLAPEHWPLVSELLLTTSAGPSLLVMLAAVLATLLISWGPAWLVDWRWAWCRWLAAHGAFTIQRYFNAVLLLQTITVLLQARLNLDRALQAIERFGDRSLTYVSQQMRQRLARGERQLAQVFGSNLLSSQMLFRLSNGGRNATEHGTLLRVAGYAGADAIAALQRLRVTLQVVCYVLIFLLLALVLGGMGAMLMAVTQQTMR